MVQTKRNSLLMNKFPKIIICLKLFSNFLFQEEDKKCIEINEDIIISRSGDLDAEFFEYQCYTE